MTEEPSQTPSAETLVEAHCPVCRRTAYAREGVDMACPVCSSPLLPAVVVAPAATTESQAS